jgi:amino acid adenylation domain-containing protein
MTLSLPDLFLDRAREHPRAVAVVSGADEVTYQELELSARRIAGALRGLGVGRESVVAVLLSPGPDLVAALLGIWLAGACYLPLDPFAPARRLRQVAEAAGALLVLVDERTSASAAELAPQLTAHRVVQLVEAGDPDAPLGAVSALHPRQAAYMIFTSGSTGAPKGVVVEHEGIANRVRWGVRALGLTPDDRVLQKTPLTFDAAGWEVFAPLACGAPVVFGRPDAGRDSGELVASIREQRITVLQVVPTMLRLLAAEPDLAACKSLRLICSAGEPLHAELCWQVLDQVDVDIWNTYGPTECSIDALAQRFDPAQRTGAVPIGRPIDNARVLMLAADSTGVQDADEALRELYLCGPGVARGYHADPARTAESFLPDPEGPPGSRMYRTGDLVREHADGVVHFVGRVDAQVKINGVRIEPGEVEAALQTHPDVLEAAVRVVAGPDGTPRLAAWVVTARAGQAGGLTDYLRDRLPPALVPALIAEIDTLPRTSSGKTDRARLPEPIWSPAARAASAPPATAEERIVLEVWRQLLEVDEVGLDEDFWSLGGHSLLLTRLAARLTKASGLEVELRGLHYATTVRRQAELLTKALKAQPIEPLPADARLPLSHAQERFWVLDRVNPRSREYLLPILVWLPSEAAAPVIQDALARLVDRHETLRTRYTMDAHGLAAIIEPVDAVPVLLHQVQTTPELLGDIVAQQLGEGFDLAAAPLFRATLIRDGGPEQLLLLVCQHIIGDGWSSRILEQELRETVTALGEGREPELPELPLRYVDAVAWQRSQLADDLLAEQLDYWRQTLADLPALELPGIGARARQRSIAGAGVVVDVPRQSAETLLALGRRVGATPYVTFLTLWTVTLARAAGQWDFGIGSPVAGRTRPELHDLVGLFLNTVVLRPGLTPDMSFAEAVAQVDLVCREGFARHAAPFEAVADAVAPARDLSGTPLFQTLFALTGDGVVGQRPRDRDLELLGQAWKVARTDVALTLWPYPDGRYGGAIEYSSALYDETVMKELAERLSDLAEQFAADPDLVIGASVDEEREALEDAPADPSAARLETIVGFMSDLIEYQGIGPDDDFMALGGNSLLVARLLWSVQIAFDVEVSMRAFFDRPTATDLAREVEELVQELSTVRDA